MILQNIRSDDIWMNRFSLYSLSQQLRAGAKLLLSHFVFLPLLLYEGWLDDSMLFRFIKVGSCQCAFASVKLKHQDKDFARMKLKYHDKGYLDFIKKT